MAPFSLRNRNSVDAGENELDQKHGTDYPERFKKWLMYIQDENLMVVGAMIESMHGAGSPLALNPQLSEASNDIHICIGGCKAIHAETTSEAIN